MTNFSIKNSNHNVEEMLGKEVYFVMFPECPNGPIYRGTLLGYGAYGTDPERKSYCIYVDKGDGYRFVDYFQDECFKSKKEYDRYRQHIINRETYYTVRKLRQLLELRDEHLLVKIRIGSSVYPITGLSQSIDKLDPSVILAIDKNGISTDNKC